MIWPPPQSLVFRTARVDAHDGGHLLDGRGVVGVIDVQSCNLAAKAVAGISVLSTKWLSCQGVSL